MKYIVTIADQEYEVEINVDDEIILNGDKVTIDFQSVGGQPVYSLLIGGRSHEALVQPVEDGFEVLLQGQYFEATVEDERQFRLRQTSDSQASQRAEVNIKSPMPGLIVSVSVREGQAVSKGEHLVVLESMKMQNELKAPQEGVIRSLRIKAGDNVEQNQVLMTVG